jgi:hypothetical protein
MNHAVIKHQAPATGKSKAHAALLLPFMSSAMHTDFCELPTKNC